MRTYLIGAGAALAALAGLYLLYPYLETSLSGRPPAGLTKPSSGSVVAITSGTIPAIAAAPEFAFQRLEIDTSKPQSEACLVFTRALDESGATHYEDYLSLQPAAPIAVRPNGRRLCIGGLSFNRTYAAELKQGLPAATGEKLGAGETVPVELRDRPPLVQFGGGILLPRESVEGVPVTTVNIQKLNLKVLRVGDRLLTQLETGLIDETKLYGYNSEDLEQRQGSLVWTGQMDVVLSKNEAVTTLVPIRDILKKGAPGAYLILASDAAEKKPDDDDYRRYSAMFAAQWVIDSDIGLTSFAGSAGAVDEDGLRRARNRASAAPEAHGGAGLSIFARAFSDARVLSGLRLTLVARNNNILQEVKTDSSGRADFDPGFFRGGAGGDEPVAVMAYAANGDFTFLDLRRPTFDLTDRGVGGRAAPGPVDAFLYTERGVYRPGERVDATSMVRDATGHAIAAPLTLVATRPDGVEFRRVVVPAADLSEGSWHWALQLTPTAPQGRWRMSAYLDPKADPVGRVEFDVADFVPQRLKLTLTPQEKSVAPKSDVQIRVESRFLYGAPAAGLAADGEARISKDPNPFALYPGYRWGRDDDKFEDVLAPLKAPATDNAGVTTVSGNLGELADTSLPLKAEITVSVDEPGGRATTDSVTLPVKTRALWLGLKPSFDDTVREDTKAGFEAIAVDADGKRVAHQGLHYEFLNELTYFSWYEDKGEWKYASDIRTRLVASGTFAIGAGNPAVLSQTLPWGRYRLTISDPETGASTSIGFWSGWSGANAGDRPDRVAVASDKEKYQPGDIAHINIAPQSGKALIVVAGEKIYSSKLVDVPASGARVDIPVSGDWGAGAYVLVTHYRPLRDLDGHTPVRSVGLVWLQLDNTARTLTPELTLPPKIEPRQNLVIPISVKGLEPGEDAYVTLAAVDEGILQLTGFKSPDPGGYYLGKRRLAVGMHDDYGRLIAAEKAPLGQIRTGGDGFGGRPLAVVPTKTVAFYSGPVKLVDGKATVSFAIPDFNGELRLMAVAFSKDKMGSASQPLTVRDPLVADVVLPRFLAPGDIAQASLDLHNVEGAVGAYTAVLHAEGAAATGPAGRAVADVTITRDLKLGERELAAFSLRGVEPGIATVSLVVTGPGGFKVARNWQIEVRPAQLPLSRSEVALIKPGQTWSASASLVSGVVPSTATIALSVSATRSYTDVVGMLHWLDRYPFGCLEQTTSRAMPLLVFNDLAAQAGLPQDAELRPRIQDSIDRVLDMQRATGGFGLWGPSDTAEPWLSVFAMDFLYQAKAKGFVVPDDGLRRGAGYLQAVASSNSDDDSTRAYAFYVLSREGLSNLSDLRYFADVKAPGMANAIGPALLGDALAQAGDKARASFAFNRARTIALASTPETYIAGDHYSSLLRDMAGVTALAVEAGEPELVPALLQRSDTINMNLNYTTTQEKAWMLRAAYEMSKVRAPLEVNVNGVPGQPIAGAVRLAPTLAELQKGVTIQNRGQAAVWRTVSVEGVPSAQLPAEAAGLTLKKSLWTLSGQPADLAKLKQNDRVIVVIEGQMSDDYFRQMAAIDLLPAGLEIETTLSGEEGNVYPFLGKLSATSIAEARDDRYAASFTIGSRFRWRVLHSIDVEPQPEFKLAYVARVVSPGRFALPAAEVEDMYAPTVHARTAMGTMASTAAQ